MNLATTLGAFVATELMLMKHRAVTREVAVYCNDRAPARRPSINNHRPWLAIRQNETAE